MGKILVCIKLNKEDRETAKSLGNFSAWVRRQLAIHRIGITIPRYASNDASALQPRPAPKSQRQEPDEVAVQRRRASVQNYEPEHRVELARDDFFLVMDDDGTAKQAS